MSARSQSDEGVAEPESPRHRRTLRAVLLALAVLGLAGGSWWADHNRAAAPQAGTVPEIHADPTPVKEAPRDPGGMVVPDQDSALLNRNVKPKIEELLPPPETALPRPAAPPPPAPAAAPSVAASGALAPSESTAVAPVAPPPPAAAPAPVAPTPQIAATATKPPPVAPPAPVARASPAAGGGYRLQLGALRSEDAAKQEWQRLQHQAPDVLGHLGMTVSRIDLGEKGPYYRIQAGPIAEEGVASAACSILKSRSIGCLLVKP